VDLGIRGRVALVAASSRGLGRASAEALAAEGAELVLCARGEAALREAAASIRRTSGVRVVEVVADVATRPASRRSSTRRGARSGTSTSS
jgi:3-oxoacyl-[acyl-carrier protein] reductase